MKGWIEELGFMASLLNYTRYAVLVSYCNVGLPMLAACYVAIAPFLIFGSGSLPKMAGVVYMVFVCSVWVSFGLGVYQLLWNFGRINPSIKERTFAGSVRAKESEAFSKLVLECFKLSRPKRWIVYLFPVAILLLGLMIIPWAAEFVLYIKYHEIWGQYFIRNVTLVTLAVTAPFGILHTVAYQALLVLRVKKASTQVK